MTQSPVTPVSAPTGLELTQLFVPFMAEGYCEPPSLSDILETAQFIAVDFAARLTETNLAAVMFYRTAQPAG